MRDFMRIQKDPPPGISAAPNENNVLVWHAVVFGCGSARPRFVPRLARASFSSHLIGHYQNCLLIYNRPEGTPWEGGTFRLRLEFSEAYPNEPPKAFFTTKVFHPNVYNNTGAICLDILQARLLRVFRGVLIDPVEKLESCVRNSRHLDVYSVVALRPKHIQSGE